MIRTKTYIAGDWSGDKKVIDQLYFWKNNPYCDLYFQDAHELSQSNDDSKPCSIKKSLAYRLDNSKTFVLIVGEKTSSLTKGSCRWCESYDYYHSSCHAGGNVSYKSFVEFECDKALKDRLKIVVIYNGTRVIKENCIKSVQNIGTHIPAFIKKYDGTIAWNYVAIKSAIMNNIFYSF